MSMIQVKQDRTWDKPIRNKTNLVQACPIRAYHQAHPSLVSLRPYPFYNSLLHHYLNWQSINIKLPLNVIQTYSWRFFLPEIFLVIKKWQRKREVELSLTLLLA